MHADTAQSLILAQQCLGPAETVICLHSSTGTQAQWKPLLPRLQPAMQPLALDLYGHGRSPAWPAEAPSVLDVDARPVAALIDALDAAALAQGEAAGVHLVGHSYGAAVALRVALRRPQAVRSLTLYEPVLFGLLPAADPARHEIEDIARSVAALVRAGALADAARVFVGYWGGATAWHAMNEVQQASVMHRINTVPRHFEALLSVRWGASQFKRLAGVPTLLLQGGATRAPARGVVRCLEAALPHAAVQTVAAAGHLGPITHGAEVLPLMQQHVFSQARIGSAATAVRAAADARPRAAAQA
jgi:pimeloyl-ACP methyl ester carboxylesterase